MFTVPRRQLTKPVESRVAFPCTNMSRPETTARLPAIVFDMRVAVASKKPKAPPLLEALLYRKDVRLISSVAPFAMNRAPPFYANRGMKEFMRSNG
jgi:hypothetical protein